MLVIRCANAVVLWRVVQPVAENPGNAHCLNDGFSVPFPDRIDATLVAAIQAIAAHSVTIGGAIGQVVDLVELS